MYIHEKDNFFYSPNNEAPNNAKIDTKLFETNQIVKLRGKYELIR